MFWILVFSCLETVHLSSIYKIITYKMYKPIWLDLNNFFYLRHYYYVDIFKSFVLSRLDYGFQLWSPHLVKNIDQLEKIQRSFTKHITRMQSLDYSDRLVYLKLHYPLKIDVNTIVLYMCGR